MRGIIRKTVVVVAVFAAVFVVSYFVYSKREREVERSREHYVYALIDQISNLRTQSGRYVLPRP